MRSHKNPSPHGILCVLFGILAACSHGKDTQNETVIDSSAAPVRVCNFKILADAVALDPKSVARMYDGSIVADCTWIELYNAVFLTDGNMLEVLPQIYNANDGIVREELQIALGRALQDHPQEALTVMKKIMAKQKVTGLCSSVTDIGDLDEHDEIKMVRTKLNDLRLREAGLENVKIKPLQTIKAKCLRDLHSAIKHYEGQLPP